MFSENLHKMAKNS